MKKRKFPYQVVGFLLSYGEVKEFRDLQDLVSKVNFGKEIGVGYKRMNQLFGSDVSSLSLGEILKAAQLLDVEFKEVLKIALIQYQKEVDPKCKTIIISAGEMKLTKCQKR